jgi:hypothetical protein
LWLSDALAGWLLVGGLTDEEGKHLVMIDEELGAAVSSEEAYALYGIEPSSQFDTDASRRST